MIFTDSHCVEDEVKDVFGVKDGKVRTIHLGVDKEYVRLPAHDACRARVKHKYGIHSEYLLFVGTIEKRKNVLSLVHAMTQLRHRTGFQLVLAGFDSVFRGKEGFCVYFFAVFGNNLNLDVWLSVQELEFLFTYDFI
jgi:glycosyltransferase involved in cell wall biosynthesis